MAKRKARKLKLRLSGVQEKKDNVPGHKLTEVVFEEESIELSAADIQKKEEKEALEKEKERSMLRVQDAKIEPFDALHTYAVPPQRRHSIGDPMRMSLRLHSLQSNLAVRGFSRRRYSLPGNMKVSKTILITKSFVELQ